MALPPGSPRVSDEILRRRGGGGHGNRVGKPSAQASLALASTRRRLPKPPRPLNDAGTDLWKRIWGSDIEWISADTDVETVLVLCELADMLALMRRRLAEEMAFDTVETSVSMKRGFDVMKDVRREYQQQLSMLGLTPVDRIRFTLSDTITESPLDLFRSESA